MAEDSPREKYSLSHRCFLTRLVILTAVDLRLTNYCDILAISIPGIM